MSYYPLTIGGAIPDWLQGPFEAIGTLFSGTTGNIIDLISSLFFAYSNLLLWLAFKAITVFTGVAYDVMLAALTVTPVPVDDYGADGANAVIFAEPDTASPFYSMQQVIENGIVPIALLLIVFGIVIVLFFRVFDVVIDLSFDGETAQKRLLLAPILITLWIPLANIVLVIAMGLTEFFSPGGPVQSGMDVDAVLAESDVEGLSGSEMIDTMTLLESVPNRDPSSDPVGFVTGEGINTAISLLVGIWFGLFIIPVALLAMILAFVRIFLLYILYVLGPIGIMMWATTWRSIGSIGEKIVRYFVLFALFPVPAAITGILMPVVAVGTEQAVLGSIEQIFASDSSTAGATLGSSTSTSAGTDWIGIDNIIRGSLAGTIVVIMGFTPWALVIGVGKATALAGGASIAGGAVATAGTSAIGSSVVSATGVTSSGAGSAAKAIGGGAKSKFENSSIGPDDLENTTIAAGAATVGSAATSAAGAPREAIRKGQQKAKEKRDNIENKDPEDMRERDKLMSSTFDSVDSVSATAEELSEEIGDVDKERIAAAGASQIGNGLRTFGFNNTADVLDRSGEALESHRKRKQNIRNKKNKKKAAAQDRAEIGEVIPDEMGEEDLEFMERMTGENLDKNQVMQLAAKSDKLNYSESEVDQMFNDDGTFREGVDEDAKRAIGSATMREVNQADDRAELNEQFGQFMADEMTDAVQFDPSRKELMEHAEEMDSVSKEQVANGEFEELERYSLNGPRDYNPLVNNNRWVGSGSTYDREEHKEAVNQLESGSESFAEESAHEAVQDTFEDEDVTEGQITGPLGNRDDELARAYREGEFKQTAERILDEEADMEEAVDGDISEDKLEEKRDQIVRTVAEQYDEKVKENVENSDQLGQTSNFQNTDNLLDNNTERAVSVEASSVDDADASDIDVDPEAFVPQDQLEEELREMQVDVGPDSTLEDVLEATQQAFDEQQPIRSSIDEQQVERQLRGTRYLENAENEEEVIRKFQESIAQSTSKQVKAVNDDMAKVTAKTLNDMSNNRREELGEAIESSFEDLSMDDITDDNGQIVADKIQELEQTNSMSIVEGALNEAKESVIEDVRQVADKKGYDNAERLVEEVNNMNAEDISELQGTDVEQIMADEEYMSQITDQTQRNN